MTMISEWIQTHAMLLSMTQTMSTPPLSWTCLSGAIEDGTWPVTGRAPDSRSISGLFTWTQGPLAASVAVLGDQPSYYEHLRLSWMTAMDQSDDQRSSPSSLTGFGRFQSRTGHLPRWSAHVRVRKKNLGRKGPQKQLLPRSIGVGKPSSRSHEEKVEGKASSTRVPWKTHKTG